MLYNHKVESATTDNLQVGLNIYHPFEITEAEVEKLEVSRRNPLKDLDKNLHEYAHLIKIFSDFKKFDINLANSLLGKIKANNTFSGDDLYMIKNTFDIYYTINQKMLEFADTYQFRNTTMARTFGSPEIKKQMAKAHLVWLSGYLMALDHTQEIHELLYENDGGLRRVIKNIIDDKSLGKDGRDSLKLLGDLTNRVVSVGQSSKFIQQINLMREIEADVRKSLAEDTVALSLLDEIVNNPTSKEIARGKRKFKIHTYGFVDAVVNVINKITNALSGFFGNIAGSIKWRKGYLNGNQTAIDMTKASLRPMDMLLEKSSFVLTDKFIPGHYGHAALYLGTRKQLEEIGMWDHPSLQAYQAEIEAGKVILEAVRPGVRLTSIEDFFNIDEITVVRKADGISYEDVLNEQIKRGIDQIGKSYDFNFDISTLDKIVCSELLYIVFGNVNWPTHYRVGRPTITPDDLAEILFYKGTQFNVAKYIVSTERHRIELTNVHYLANIFNYELRAENGTPMTNVDDPTNSFWKKEEKCYTIVSNSGEKESETRERVCKTTYKEFYYEEMGL